MRAAFLAAALLVAVPSHAAAQAPVRIDPKEAMQCAVWASILSESVDDQETKTALGFTLSYFIGQYEGATGISVTEGHDEAAVTAVALDPDAYTPICQRHMEEFSPRMIEWGAILNNLGEQLVDTK